MQEKKEVRKMIKQFRDAATDAEVAARKNAEFGRQQLEETQARGLQNAEQGTM